MRPIGRILLRTLIRGVVFLVPVVIVAVVAREGYAVLHRIAEPVARLLPGDRLFGFLVEDLVTIAAIVVVFLVAGLFVGTPPGRSLSDRLERNVLYRVPGYLLIQGAMRDVPGLGPETHVETALVETGEGWAFALIIERQPEGFCTVFLPDSPTPTTGAVRIIEVSRVRPLDATMMGFLSCLTRSGAGAGSLAGEALRKTGSSTEEPNRARPL